MGPSARNAPHNLAGSVALAGLCVVVLVLSSFAFWGAFAVKRAADEVEHSRTLADAYGRARDEVAAEDFWVTEYLLQLIPDFEAVDAGELRRSHAQAATGLTRALERAGSSGTARDRALSAGVLARHERYLADVQRLFAAVDTGAKQTALAVEVKQIDPSFEIIEGRVESAAKSHQRTADQSLGRLERVEQRVFAGTLIVFPIGMLLLAVLAFRLRSDRRDELTGLRAAALTDNLTGLANHRAFQQQLQAAFARHRRSSEPLSLVMLDLDGLKQINDTHGHPRGDAALKTVAQQLRSSAREGDGVFRVGGDEFAAILPGSTAWEALRFVARLQAQLGDTRATAGICELADAMSREAFVRSADEALLEAKRSHDDARVFRASPAPEASIAGV